jgi:hypothetical protein
VKENHCRVDKTLDDDDDDGLLDFAAKVVDE